MAYYLEVDDRALLKKLRLTHVCSDCGGKLVPFFDLAQHLPYLICEAHPEAGIGKPHRREDNSYEGGLRQMVEAENRYGIDKTRQLAKYQGVTSLTRSEAMEILETIWPEAPMPDKLAAAILCSSYGLNPLANHVFLIPFKERETGEITWARVWGIKAKRLLASRRGGYSYLDMSPRLMTEDEQIKVWGEVDQVNLCYITHLKDMLTGGEVYGYGKWAKNKQPKGTDKGNSQANMASIRSESQALDRLRPAEMATSFTVADENYIDAEVSEMSISTLDNSEKQSTEGKGRDIPPVTESEGKKTPRTKRDPATIKNIGELRQALLDDFGLQPAQQLAELNLNSWTELASPSEAYQQVAATRPLKGEDHKVIE